MKPHFACSALWLMTSALGFAEIAVVYIDASGRMAGDRDIYVNGRWIGEAPG